MSGHTPTPWIVEGTSVYYLDWDGVSYEGRGKDYQKQLTNRFWLSVQGQERRIPKEELEANAAFIVKAVNSYAANEAKIDALAEALAIEEQYLLRHFDADCGIMPGDVEGSFHRLRAALQAAGVKGNG